MVIENPIASQHHELWTSLIHGPAKLRAQEPLNIPATTQALASESCAQERHLRSSMNEASVPEPK